MQKVGRGGHGRTDRPTDLGPPWVLFALPSPLGVPCPVRALPGPRGARSGGAGGGRDAHLGPPPHRRGARLRFVPEGFPISPRRLPPLPRAAGCACSKASLRRGVLSPLGCEWDPQHPPLPGRFAPPLASLLLTTWPRSKLSGALWSKAPPATGVILGLSKEPKQRMHREGMAQSVNIVGVIKYSGLRVGKSNL